MGRVSTPTLAVLSESGHAARRIPGTSSGSTMVARDNNRWGISANKGVDVLAPRIVEGAPVLRSHLPCGRVPPAAELQVRDVRRVRLP